MLESPPRPWWRQPLVWLGFGLSALALVALRSLFDPRQVYLSLIRLDLWVLPSAVAAIIAAFLIRAVRWRLLLRPVARLPLGLVRDVLFTGFMVNNVLPARAGELARALALWKVSGTSRRATLATVAVERLLDLTMLFAMLALLGLLFEVPPWTRQLGLVTVVVLCCLAGGVIWMTAHHRSLLRVTAGLLFFLPAAAIQRLVTFMERFVEGTRALRSPSLTAQALACSAAIWSLEVAAYLLVLRGFPIDLPAWAAILAVVVANFGIAAPSAPGYLGVFDAACSSALMALGQSPEVAVAYAVAVHLTLFLTVTSSGLVSLWRLELKLSQLTQGRHGSAPGA